MLRRVTLLAAVVVVMTVAVAGSAWAAVRVGDGGPNNLVGTLGSDELYGLGGNDTLNARAGNDYLAGGRGNDSVSGGAGLDDYCIADSSDEIDFSTCEDYDIL